MKYQINMILYYILFFVLLIIRKCKSQSYNENNANYNFTMKTYDENDEYISTHHITYNNVTKKIDNYDKLLALGGFKYTVICNDDDLKSKDRKTLTFWNTSVVSSFYSAVFYLNAYPMFYYNQKKKGNTFCFRIDSVGWFDNAYREICNDQNIDDPSIPCPDIIILDTAQLTYRYYKGETMDLNKYFRNYFLKTGKSFESLLNKYSYYDYHVGNHWLAVPLSADFRIFKFNITTFDKCIERGYDLHYPPPLSDYWGENYEETWTWDKAFEYADMIRDCTGGSPGLKILHNYNEDLKFFISLCQSLKIPIFVDDPNYDGIKKCGLRGEENVKKLTSLKHLLKRHNIEMWLNKTQVEMWQKSEYPKSVEEQPIITYDDDIVTLELSHANINDFVGMMLTSLFMLSNAPNLKMSYTPGSSTYLGGTGAVITKRSQFPDEAFEFIELLINDNLPYFSELNISITPFENIYGSQCRNIPERNKQHFCNLLLQNSGTYPYYFIYNNTTQVVYLTHIKSDDSDDSVNGVVINSSNIKNTIIGENGLENETFMCDKYADFQSRKITYDGEYRIEFPISENENIVLKSMKDVDENINIDQSQEKKCSIYDETIKKAKPIEFPYNNFPEINQLQQRSPIGLLFAHLYYGHNTTEDTPLESIINECCDIIDDSLFPLCDYTKQINFTLGECNEKENKRQIIYNNCKLSSTDIHEFGKKVECSYIPHAYSKGLLVTILSIVAMVVEFFLFIMVLINRHKKCIYISGFNFLITFIITSILLELSIFYYVGLVTTYKCIVKIWLTIIGMTGYICSYSVKAEMIISIYNNQKLTKTNIRNKSYLIYYIIACCQLILLIIWSFTFRGIESESIYLENVGYYNNEICSIGNIYILNVIFVIDYILLIISIIISYRGRNIPDEFNESKKMFLISIISAFQLLLCYLSIMRIVKETYMFVILLILIVSFTLIINVIFIGSKILIIYDIITPTTLTSVMVVSTKDKSAKSVVKTVEEV